MLRRKKTVIFKFGQNKEIWHENHSWKLIEFGIIGIIGIITKRRNNTEEIVC